MQTYAVILTKYSLLTLFKPHNHKQFVTLLAYRSLIQYQSKVWTHLLIQGFIAIYNVENVKRKKNH
jgi:hypothetical protein